jgi:uncharacterized protein (TIGR03083 family)
MESARYLETLAADEARLRELATGDLGAAVPSCPGWTVTELVRHVAEVYLHKAEAMRRGEWPRPWPPDLTGEPPIEALDRSYAALVAEFAARHPQDPTVTWFAPDQTVGFWIRRMAQETVIHRVDCELARGTALAPIPPDLAFDGIDEVLVRFLAHASREWPEEFGDHLADCDGRSVLVTAGGDRWLVRLTTQGVEVTPRGGPQGAQASVAGEADDVLLWLWRRVDDDAVGLGGDRALAGKLRQLLGDATQ